MLVKNAQNLMEAVVRLVRACETASIKCDRAAVAQDIKWIKRAARTTDAIE